MRIAQGGLTRDEARRARQEEKDADTRPRPFVFDYHSPDSAYHFRIQFRRSQISRDDLIRSLREILSELEAGSISSSAA